MHGIELTPTQRQIADRRRQFRRHIAARAGKLAERNVAVVAPAAEPEAAPKIEQQPAYDLPPPKPIWFSIVDGPVFSIRDVQDAVCQRFGVSRADLLSERRIQKLVFPRHIAMYLAKELTKRSLTEIGRRFHGRDHATAIHAVRKIERLIKTDPDVAKIVRELRGQFDDHSYPSCLPADQAPGAPASDCSPALTSGSGEAAQHPAHGIGVAA